MATSECSGCGTAFEWTRTSPKGRRRKWCDECLMIYTARRYGSGYDRPVTCSCGTEFRTSVGHTECRECRKIRTCRNPECGATFKIGPGEGVKRYCSRVCANRRPGKTAHESEAARLRDHCRRRRAMKLGAECDGYTTAEIAERDGYICQWWECGKIVDMALSGLDQWGPTIDHRTPLTRGGDDTRDNVQLMHRVCNIIKGDRMPV